MTQTTGRTHTCIACGQPRDEAAMRPFGRHEGHVVTWACETCLEATPQPAAAPDVPLTAALLEVLA